MVTFAVIPAQRQESSGTALTVRLSKTRYYLADNIYVLILSQLTDRVQEQSGGVAEPVPNWEMQSPLRCNTTGWRSAPGGRGNPRPSEEAWMGASPSFPHPTNWVPVLLAFFVREGGAFETFPPTAKPRCSSVTTEATPGINLVPMPWGLKRYQQTGNIHFIAFSCYRRDSLLAKPQARDTFVATLGTVHRWYAPCVIGFVVMPEHVHLLLSEPERGRLAVVLQMLKQGVSHKLNTHATSPFWQPRYYDFNLYREPKLGEKLDYMHRKPAQRGLIARPEDGPGAARGTTLLGKNARLRLSRAGPRFVGSSLECIRWFGVAM